MEFYGSEAKTSTEAKPRSILLPKIHKTHIAPYHRSIFALLYVYGWSPLVYEYIYCWNVFNNLLPSHVLQSGAWCYYCDIILSCYNIDTMVAPEWHFYQTIVQYDERTILEHIAWSIWYFESVWTITDGHMTRNLPISIEYLQLTMTSIHWWYKLRWKQY